MATQTRKLSIKVLVGDIKAIIKTGVVTEKKPLKVARIVGSVLKVTKMADRFDPTKESYCFVGQFRGQSLLDKDIVIDSNRCYLPSFMAEMLLPAVEESEGEAVEFAVDVILALNEKSPVGYSFDVVSLMEATQNATLDRLMNDTLRLSAPKKTPKKAA